MIPFSPPRIDDEIINEVIDTLKSGWITTGPKTLAFENNLTTYCGNKATVCLSSATAGLQLILNWFGVGEGDEVILPAYTYCATANVVTHCGAKIVLVDVNNNDFNINIKNIEKAITKNTKVIMPVDIGGFPCDYDEINKLVNDKKALFNAKTANQKKLGRILVLSDSAHSLGASYKNKKAGSLADVSVFSFHAVKNLSTAEGGAIALNLPEQFNSEIIRKELKIKSLHGQSKDALAKTKVGGWKYDVVEAGFKCNMTDIQASMGLVELNRYDENLAKRKYICDKYNNFFSKKSWANTPTFNLNDKVSSYHLYMLRIKNINENQRNKIIELISEKNVAVNVHFLPIPMLTAYKNKFLLDDFPNTYANYACEISLPVFYNLTDDQIATVIEVVTNAVEHIIA